MFICELNRVIMTRLMRYLHGDEKKKSRLIHIHLWQEAVINQLLTKDTGIYNVIFSIMGTSNSRIMKKVASHFFYFKARWSVSRCVLNSTLEYKSVYTMCVYQDFTTLFDNIVVYLPRIPQITYYVSVQVRSKPFGPIKRSSQWRNRSEGCITDKTAWENKEGRNINFVWILEITNLKRTGFSQSMLINK